MDWSTTGFPPPRGWSNAHNYTPLIAYHNHFQHTPQSGDIETNPGPNNYGQTDPIYKGPGQQQRKPGSRPYVKITDSLQLLQLNAQSIKGNDLDKTK